MNTVTRWPDTLPCVVQSPMAGTQNHRLAAAVCEVGGLGSLPSAMLSPADLERELQTLTQATQRPYNVNFFCHTPPTPDASVLSAWQQTLTPYYRALGLTATSSPSGATRVPFNHEAADVLQAFRPAVLSFHFGLPAPDLLARVKGWGSCGANRHRLPVQPRGQHQCAAPGGLAVQRGATHGTDQPVHGSASAGHCEPRHARTGPHAPLAPAFPLATAEMAPLRSAAEALGSSDFTPLWAGQHARCSPSLPAADITRDFLHAWCAA